MLSFTSDSPATLSQREAITTPTHDSTFQYKTVTVTPKKAIRGKGKVIRVRLWRTSLEKMQILHV